MADKIFINYRREDSIGTAGRLRDRLAEAFGEENLFMDVDNIPAGVDFAADLNSQVAACRVFVAVIGPNWLDAKDESGARRLDNPDDFVTIEIAAALARDIRVIPVLVDNARMPKADKLPEPIRPLVRRNAVEVRNTQFRRDAETLVARMREALGEKAAKPGRWNRGAIASLAVVAVSFLIIGERIYTTGVYTAWREWQQAEAIKAGQERPATAAAEAEEKRKAEQVEQQRLAALRAERDRQTKAAAEAEEKRKAEQAEQRRAAEAEAKRKADEAERQRSADAIAASAPTVRWKLQNTFPTATPTTLPLFVKRVGELSGGRMSVDLLPAGAVAPAFQIASAVSGGMLDLGYGLGNFLYGKDKAFALMAGVPFGFEPREHLAFRRRADVAAIFDRLLAKEGIVALPCGSFGRNGDLWLKKPLSATAGLAGAKLRFVALPIEIYQKIGSAVFALPGGEIVPAMDRGLIEGGQFIDPKSDLDLGLPDVAKYYYYPGSVMPSYMLDLFIAKSKWDRLPPAGRQIVEQACREAVDAMLDQYDRLGEAALGDIARRGVTVAPLPAAVQRDLYRASLEVLTKLAGENEAVRSLMAIVDQMRPSTIAGKMR